MIRIGLVGACGSVPRLRLAFDLLLNEVDADPVLYLGSDDVFDQAVREMPGARVASDEMLLRAAAAVALRGRAEEIEGLLAAERQVARLARLSAMPPAPALAVEMLGDQIVLLVHDPSSLQEEDIENASIIVHEAERHGHRRVGRRHFVSPGLLDRDEGCVGFLHANGRAAVRFVLVHLDGRVETEIPLPLGASSQMIVSGGRVPPA